MEIKYVISQCIILRLAVAPMLTKENKLAILDTASY